MMPNPTQAAPVSDYVIGGKTLNPFNLTMHIRDSLSSVFCNAFHYHRSDYVARKRDLANHLAKEDRDEKHDKVLISLCSFSERGMRETAQTYKDMTGSEFWLNELEKIIVEFNQAA